MEKATGKRWMAKVEDGRGMMDGGRWTVDDES